MQRVVNWCAGSMPAMGFGGSFFAAMERNAFMAWTAAGVGAAGLIVQGILSWYRQAREARRIEDEKDHLAELEVVRLLGKVQLELEARIIKSEHDILELVRRIDCVRCTFPNADGSPRCKGLEKPPCTV